MPMEEKIGSLPAASENVQHDIQETPTRRDFPTPDRRMTTWNTSSEVAQEEENALQHRPRRRYIISRPKVRQYAYKGQIIRTASHIDSSDGDQDVEDAEDDTTQSRERLDMFIDLIWVGIVGNIAEAFSSRAFGDHEDRVSEAFLVFVIVFLPSWRVWNGIREILNNYYRDDLFQRSYILILLVLSVFFGNSLAYTTEKPIIAKISCISLFLFFRACLLFIEAASAIFIPWLRRLVLLETVLYLPSIGLWITAVYVEDTKAIGPMFAAIVLDYTVPVILDLPMIRKTMLAGYGKALDAEHFTSRMGSFFTIVVGEGVLQLIQNGPLGIGITRAASYATWGLVIYFLLTILYFNRDSSQRFVPAVVTKGWRTWLWITWHIPTFMSMLTLSAGINYTVRETAAQLDIETKTTAADQSQSPEEIARLTNTALWTITISLATVVLSMSCMALLDQPRDTGKRLRVNNRYLRLAGRPIYAVIVLCVPINNNVDPEICMTICGVLMVLLTLWEFIASTERGNGIVEPRKATRLSASSSPTQA